MFFKFVQDYLFIRIQSEFISQLITVVYFQAKKIHQISRKKEEKRKKTEKKIKEEKVQGTEIYSTFQLLSQFVSPFVRLCIRVFVLYIYSLVCTSVRPPPQKKGLNLLIYFADTPRKAPQERISVNRFVRPPPLCCPPVLLSFNLHQG